MDLWPYALIGAGLLAIVAVMMRRRCKPSAAMMVFGFEPSKLEPQIPPKRSAAPPIDLRKPIGRSEWDKLSRLRPDAGFRNALDGVRKRYELSHDPMLVSRAIAEVMDSKRVDIFEAIMLIARDRSHDAY